MVRRRGLLASLVLCCGGDFAISRINRSKRGHASGSSSICGVFVNLGFAMSNHTTHDRNWRDLKEAYAEAMWTWAEVEGQIFTIYVAAVGVLKLDIRPLQASFFAVNSFEARLIMTSSAVKQRWGEKHPHFAKWASLRERCDKAAGERGRIAHKTGTYWPIQKPHQHPLYILSDPSWHFGRPQKWGVAKSTGFDAPKLRQFAEGWHRVCADLHRFSLELWSETLQSTFSAQPADPSLPLSHRDARNPKES